MKYIFTLFMLIISSQALATLTLLDDQNLLITPPPPLPEEYLVTSSSVNFSYQQGLFNFEKTLPAFKPSSNQYIEFSNISLTGNNGLIIRDNYTLQGINMRYSKNNLRLELAMLSNNSLTISEEKIFIQGLLNIWTLENFNLSIKGRIEASRAANYTANLTQGSIIPIDREKFNKSLSVVSSYVLNDHWAVTGTVMKIELDKELKNRINYNKNSDNIAIIGTVYSF
tara:strand:+ start:1581 stop:2258 length:678 start_codon:yes stop_codon:yes gene_type:complete